MIATQSAYSMMTVDRIGSVTVVRFRGRSIVEERAIRTISGELVRQVENFGNRQVLLNFGEVKNLSSYMLAGIVSLHKKLHDLGGKVALCGLNPELLKVFELTKLNKLLSIYDDEREALANTRSQ